MCQPAVPATFVVHAMVLPASILMPFACVVSPIALIVLASVPVETARRRSVDSNYVLEWNQVFVETFIAMGTPTRSASAWVPSSTQRSSTPTTGIEGRYVPVFV